MYNMIVSQLEKALASEDDKELRLRIEVLLDIVKEQQRPITVTPTVAPTPQPTYYEAPPKPTVNGQASPKVNGAGAIVSNGEQINYTRPKGT